MLLKGLQVELVFCVDGMGASLNPDILADFFMQFSQQERQLAKNDRCMRELRQQLASKDLELAEKDREISRLVGLCSDGLLKHPPVRALVESNCMVCFEAIPSGSIIFMQKGCALLMCQSCASEMCQARMRSSGRNGNSNGELMCTHCTPGHSIAPATLARVVPEAVFQGLQVRFCLSSHLLRPGFAP